jgi:hypothetical protein
LEAITIESGIEGLNINYETHIENIGWESDAGSGIKSNGQLSGTEGQGLRLEAIKINLSGDNADQYDVYYQVHAQNFGWLGWAKNGEASGTSAFGYRLEAIKIVILPIGSEAPGSTENAYIRREFADQEEASAYLQQSLTTTYESYTYQGFDTSKGYEFLCQSQEIQAHTYYVSPKGSIYDPVSHSYKVKIIGDETLPYLCSSDEAKSYLKEFLNSYLESPYSDFSEQMYDESKGYSFLGLNEGAQEHPYYVSPAGSIFDKSNNRFVYYIAEGQTLSLENDQERIDYLNAYLKSCFEYVPGITTECTGWDSENGRIICGSEERNGVLHDVFEYIVYDNGNIKLNYAPVG